MKRITRMVILACLVLVVPFGSLQAAPAPRPLQQFTVTRQEYTFGNNVFTPNGFPGVVELTAVVHHPADLSSGPFSLILFMHGRHATCFQGTSASLQWPCVAPAQPIPSYTGYDYIAQDLASRGYIVVSISANGVNAADEVVGVNDNGASARAELFQRHLDIWRDLNTGTGVVTPFSTAPFGNQFVGRVNLNNVGTMGHSRGGDGAVAHFAFNQVQGTPYGIKAVLPVAPINTNRTTVNNVPLGVILPYCDGDVSTLEGIQYYDDARYNVPGDPAAKHTFLFMGANHNFFNTNWTPSIFAAGASDDWLDNPRIAGARTDPHCGSVAGNRRLTDVQQRAGGLAYIANFFRAYLGAETNLLPALAGEVALLPPSVAGDIFVSYHAPDDPTRRRDVNRLLDAGNLTTNTLGGAVAPSGLNPYDLCGGPEPQPQFCLSNQSFFRQPHTPNVNSTQRGLSQLRIAWSNTSATYRNDLAPGSRDVSGFQRLQFRVGVNFADALNPVNTPQDFSVVLTDGAGTSASTRVSAWSNALFYPPGTNDRVPKILLNMARIPLAAFSGVNLTDIRSVQFNFDQRTSGALLISDIAFTNVGNFPTDVYMLVDLTGSFVDDLPNFKAEAPNVISNLRATNPDTRFGLGMFKDYPIPPFGQPPGPDFNDVAYQRLLDLDFDTAKILSTIEGLSTRGFAGDDAPESQLAALFQTATGAGQDLSGAGFPEASIAPNQQANFRDGAAKVILLWTDAPFHNPNDPGTIPYPGPSFDQAVNAIQALDPPLVVGLAADTPALVDLRRIATATGALAPAGGVDCNGDGMIEIPAGQPLVCQVASNAVGIGNAATALVQSAVQVRTADLAVRSSILVHPPAFMRLGQSATVTVRTTMTNRGPAGPVDATLGLTAASSTSGVSVSPVSASQAVPALAVNEQRTRDQTYTVRCVAPGVGRVSFGGQLRAVVADQVDPDRINNRADAAVIVRCVAPIYASDSLDLRDRVVVAAPAVFGGLSFTLGADAVVRGNIESQGDAFLRSRARIEGTLTLSGTLQQQDGVVITGGVIQRPSVFVTGLPTQNVPAGSTNLTVPNDQSTTWAPGSYADGIVRARGAVTLTAGTYTFRSLRFEPDTRVVLNTSGGPIVVNVVDALEFGDRVRVEGGSVETVTFYTNTTGQARVGVDVAFRGVLIVPQGELVVFSKTTTTAQLWAKRIRIEPDVNAN